MTIRVGANFDPLPCNAFSAILGSAGPSAVYRDFSGAPMPSTWYPAALANALHGSDLDTAEDIGATFSSAIGTTCPFPSVWYYGLDANPPGGTIDFASVVLHELGHGLGFLTFVNLKSGAKLSGFDDVFMLHLERHGASPSAFPSMTDAQRAAASSDTGNLHWVGPHVEAASGVLTEGRVGSHVRMYAPDPPQSGSSVSHWDTALSPDQVMEPSYTGALQEPDLEIALFQDIGWKTVLDCHYSINPTVASFPPVGGSGSVTVTAPAGCSWTVTNPVPGVVITSGRSGTGNGHVNYSVAANSGSTPRSGTLTVAGQAFTLTQAGSPVETFADVPPGHVFFPFIEALAEAGITGGCLSQPPQYCPDLGVKRDQMAVFLLRGLHGAGYQPDPAMGTVFTDVPASQPFASWIEQLAREAISGGCGAATYCPDLVVTRDQMAVLLLRAKHGAGYQPPPATGSRFTDVPASQPFADWIEQLEREGISGGCGATTYCPGATVTRGQMAVFLVRTFGLLL